MIHIHSLSIFSIVTIAILFSSRFESYASLITNGSFEIGSAALDGTNGWFEGTGDEARGFINTAGTRAAADGTRFVQFTGNTVAESIGLIYQDFATEVGVPHKVTFHTDQIGPDGAGIVAEAFSTDDLATPLSSLAVATEGSDGSSSAVWDLHTFSFVAASSVSRLSFRESSANSSSRAPLLDAVAVIAIPEPSSALIVGFALSLLGFHRRTRRVVTSRARA